MPPPLPTSLRIDGDDLFILMAVNAVIELDDHPHCMEVRPRPQPNKVGYFESDAHWRGSSITRLCFQRKLQLSSEAVRDLRGRAQ